MTSAPSLSLRIQAFNSHGSFSRYTPCNKRSRSAPVCHVEDESRSKFPRIKSESAIEVTLPVPLAQAGVYTFGYRTLTFGGESFFMIRGMLTFDVTLVKLATMSGNTGPAAVELAA